MNNAGHAVLIVLYNIMSFTCASKNCADTSNNQQGNYASVDAPTLKNQKCWIYTTAKKHKTAINNSVFMEEL